MGYIPSKIKKRKTASSSVFSWSNPGDTVLDPFAGSGTTLKMAEETGRDSIGIEISSEYCNIIRERMNALQGRLALQGRG